MAVSRMNEKKSVSVKFVEGIDTFGKDIYITSSFSGVDTDATDQKVYDVAIALGCLSEKGMLGINLRETSEIVE